LAEPEAEVGMVVDNPPLKSADTTFHLMRATSQGPVAHRSS
jgi:hypothetical protein